MASSADPQPPLPVDSDVDLHVARDRQELRRAPWVVLAAISLGGGLGSLARYAVGAALPAAPGAFPWATFLVNVSGSALIGVLMVLVAQRWQHRRLARPFLGVGVLGGYTTFSVSMVETHMLLTASAAVTGAIYLVGTVLGSLLAVAAGMAGTRWLLRRTAPTRAGG